MTIKCFHSHRAFLLEANRKVDLFSTISLLAGMGESFITWSGFLTEGVDMKLFREDGAAGSGWGVNHF